MLIGNTPYFEYSDTTLKSNGSEIPNTALK